MPVNKHFFYFIGCWDKMLALHEVNEIWSITEGDGN